MISKVVNNRGTLEFRNLAGASAAGLPVGSILALHTNRVPAGYLPCNGATYDITQYPALYTILQTNVLPDLREANLVGAGANTTHSITTHDTYTIGQFKDDQVQEVVTGAESEVTDPGHCHTLDSLTLSDQCICGSFSAGGSWNTTFSGGTGAFTTSNWADRRYSTDGRNDGNTVVCFNDEHTHTLTDSCISTNETGITVDTTITCNANSRTGSVTHGKNYGVFFVIKAVTGITELDDAEVYAQVVNLLESNYIQKSLFSEGGIPMYNSTTECFDQITPPSTSDKALTYDPATCCYCWGETASAVSNLTDVCLTNLTDGQYLQYDATNCTWNNVTLSTTWSCCDVPDIGIAGYRDGCQYYSQVACITPTTGVITTSCCLDAYFNCCTIIAPACICHHANTSEYGSCSNFLVNDSALNFSTYSTDSFDNCCGGISVNATHMCLNGNCSACYDFQTGILYVHAICFI